ncbi:FecR domain-containing protein [Pseudorhodoferax sp.]|uniref:FecR domain-containing protein n=1 Tax=Pseudorhodoferax sp. TaxID=1993553 RepID=UPI0039E4801E
MRTRPPCLSRTAGVLLGLAMLAGPAAAADLVYVVQPGDHPWNIAQRYLVRPSLAWQLVQREGIADPHHLQPGTRLRLPQAWLRRVPAALEVVATEGAARVRGGNGRWRPLAAGDRLQPPARLQTGPHDSASIGFEDGARVLLLRDSELQIHAATRRVLDGNSAVSLELLRGRVENDVAPAAAPGRRFEIHTPAAVAAVRGTRFRVQSQGTGRDTVTHAETLSGAVRLSTPAGAVLAVAGHGSTVQAGQAPATPVPLLPAPDLSQLPDTVQHLPTELAFQGLPRASGYRAQLASDAGFASTQLDEQSNAPRLRLGEHLADGRYVLRLRAIDAQGLEGLAAERPLRIHARPPPPMQIEPPPGATVTEAQPLFRWTEADAPGGSYHLQLLDQDGAPWLDQQVASASLPADRALPPGHYRWRVARIDADGSQGPFGELQAFRRTEPGPVPQLAAPAQDGRLVLSWSPQAGAAGYRLQLAQDASFAAPLLEQRTGDAQAALPALAPGRYLARVQRIGSADAPEPWGAPQSFTVEAPPTPTWPRLLLLLPLLFL